MNKIHARSFLGIVITAMIITACSGGANSNANIPASQQSYPYTETVQQSGKSATIEWLSQIPKGYLIVIVGVTGADDAVGFVPDDAIAVAAISLLVHSEAYAVSPQYRQALDQAGADIVEGAQGIRNWTIEQLTVDSTDVVLDMPRVFEANGHVNGSLPIGKAGFNVSWEESADGCDYFGEAFWGKIHITLMPIHSDNICNVEEAYTSTAKMLEQALDQIAQLTHSPRAVSFIEIIGHTMLDALEKLM